MAAGGITRGLLVGGVTILALLPFSPVRVHDPAFILFHALSASLMLSLLGVIGGIWSEKFDHLASVTNFVITPLAFLSGAFYSVERLPGIWHTIAHLDPFFYMIDGFRYGFIGHADGSLTAGIVVLTVVNVGGWALTHRMLATGYKLKA
jgi:ABC-2 type transport system permease protein